MSLSKFLIGTAFGVLCASLYHLYASKPTKEITEIFYVRRPTDNRSKLVQDLELSSLMMKYATNLLEKLIKSSRNSLYLAMFVFTSRPLAEAVIEVHQRGVKVLIVVDHSLADTKSSQVDRLREAGIPVKIYKAEPASTMHLKLVLIDVNFDEKSGKILTNTKLPDSKFKAPIDIPSKHGITITGSVNWTGSGLQSGHENFIVTSEKQVCEISAAEFFKIWEESHDD